MCEIEAPQPHSFGRRCLPFKRHLHPFFCTEERFIVEQQVWAQPMFWGKEPMTRLMRVNKLLYREAHDILWSKFALHASAGLNPVSATVFRKWLFEHNPRAFQTVKHIHYRWSISVPRSDIDPKAMIPYAGRQLTGDTLILFRHVRAFPKSCTVHFQIFIHPRTNYKTNEVLPEANTHEAKSAAVEEIMSASGLCGSVEVTITLEPNIYVPNWPGADDIMH